MTHQELVDKLASNPSESSQQQALFAWSALPEVRSKYPELKWMFAIPNGGLRFNPGKFKAEGVKSGVADIFLPVVKPGWHGLFIEMKRAACHQSSYKIQPFKKGGVLSEEQYKFKQYIIDQGYGWALAKGYEEAKEVVICYLNNGSVP